MWQQLGGWWNAQIEPPSAWSGDAVAARRSCCCAPCCWQLACRRGVTVPSGSPTMPLGLPSWRVWRCRCRPAACELPVAVLVHWRSHAEMQYCSCTVSGREDPRGAHAAASRSACHLPPVQGQHPPGTSAHRQRRHLKAPGAGEGACGCARCGEQLQSCVLPAMWHPCWSPRTTPTALQWVFTEPMQANSVQCTTHQRQSGMQPLHVSRCVVQAAPSSIAVRCGDYFTYPATSPGGSTAWCGICEAHATDAWPIAQSVPSYLSTLHSRHVGSSCRVCRIQ